MCSKHQTFNKSIFFIFLENLKIFTLTLNPLAGNFIQGDLKMKHRNGFQNNTKLEQKTRCYFCFKQGPYDIIFFKTIDILKKHFESSVNIKLILA